MENLLKQIPDRGSFPQLTNPDSSPMFPSGPPIAPLTLRSTVTPLVLIHWRWVNSDAGIMPMLS